MEPGWQQLVDDFAELVAAEGDLIANCANACALLLAGLGGVCWAGFYLVRDEDLVLGPFQGLPACTRFAPGEGFCSAVAESAQPALVPDLAASGDEPVGDPAARAALVLPMLWQDQVVGVLLLESRTVARFGDADLEGAAALVETLLGESDLWSAFGSSG